MRFCSNCGASVTPEQAFCSRCGHALQDGSAPPAAPPPPPPAQAPAPLGPLPPGSAPANPGAVVLAALRGNWLGALAVSVVTGLTAVLASIVLATVEEHDRSDIGSIVKGGVLQAFAGLGSPMEAKSRSETYHVVAMPLLITLLALGAGALAFRLLTRRYASRGAVIGDAIRTALVFGLVMMVAAIVVHAVELEWKGFPTDDDTDFVLPTLLSGQTGREFHLVPSVLGATFLPALFLLLALGISALRLRITGETGWLARAHEIARGPLDGLVTLFWVTVPTSGIFIGALELRTHHDFDVRRFASEIAVAPNLGIQTIGIGLGSGYGVSYRDGRHVVSQTDKLDKLTDHDQLHWLMWFSIPAAILVMTAVAIVVVARSSRRDALWSALVFVTVLPGVLAVLGHYANIRSYSGRFHFRSGVNLTELILVGWGAAALVCLLALLVSGRVRVTGLQHAPYR